VDGLNLQRWSYQDFLTQGDSLLPTTAVDLIPWSTIRTDKEKNYDYITLLYRDKEMA
jgi:hypothetical protein